MIERSETHDLLRLLQIMSVIEKINLVHAHPSLLPARPGARLQKPISQPTRDEVANMLLKPYRQAVGSLMYMMASTHPDIFTPYKK